MASSLIQVLQSLREKIDTLNEEVAALRSRNRLLEEDNEVLRRSIRDSEQERDRAKLDAEFLAISHRLAQNPDTIITARRLISKMIRNIDRCIEMLKE
ncbi:MAG: hypothetical protein HDS62_03385 [Bacteroidales bacterium]|nr:hypothetical protein [Bacteroidales bacterium]MDE6237028.1 hypothetical protein [Muribaculaceae bacterium]MDE6537605.1 hypothetical protein [Muribaculaceae bacterium]